MGGLAMIAAEEHEVAGLWVAGGAVDVGRLLRGKQVNFIAMLPEIVGSIVCVSLGVALWVVVMSRWT